jgi:hypothetical protein
MTLAFVNPMLREEGGWSYWWVLYPMWCGMQAIYVVATNLQIRAFQPPSKADVPQAGGKESNTRTRSGRWSISNTLLNDVAKLVRPSCVAPTTATHGGGTLGGIRGGTRTSIGAGRIRIGSDANGEATEAKKDPLRDSMRSSGCAASDTDEEENSANKGFARQSTMSVRAVHNQPRAPEPLPVPLPPFQHRAQLLPRPSFMCTWQDNTRA